MRGQVYTRRQFLQLLSMLPPVLLLEKLAGSHSGRGGTPNIIILLLDTLSAVHTSLEDYPRATTPTLERFAKRAIVYHNHYSAGNFTVPGTASLLTGLYPWSHRANSYAGKIVPTCEQHNLFQFVGPDYFRAAYSQNPYADLLLYQFQKALDMHEQCSRFSLAGNYLFDKAFADDALLAYHSAEGFALRQFSGLPGAQVLSMANDLRTRYQNARLERQYGEAYPLGLPFIMADMRETYSLEGIMAGVRQILAEVPVPFVTYLHLFPPHGPYLPPREFVDAFDEGWRPEEKPAGVFRGEIPHEELQRRMQRYDEFILATDAHLAAVLDFMEASGFLEDSYIFLTSDHGELFERGVHGHSNEYLYEPIVRVPLLVSAPGQRERVDVDAPTSSTDVLPTILEILGEPLPASLEGAPLLGFTNSQPPDPDRPVYSFVSKSTPAHGPLGPYTISMRRGDLKLIKYQGYKHIPETYELYDLRQDPEERQNLYTARPDLADGMRVVLKAKEDQIDPPALDK